MHRPVRRNALNQLYKIDPTIFPLVQANYENCVPNIIPCELRFCMIFENNAEISTILRCADFVSMLHFGYCIPYPQWDTKFSLFASRNSMLLPNLQQDHTSYVVAETIVFLSLPNHAFTPRIVNLRRTFTTKISNDTKAALSICR